VLYCLINLPKYSKHPLGQRRTFWLEILDADLKLPNTGTSWQHVQDRYTMEAICEDCYAPIWGMLMTKIMMKWSDRQTDRQTAALLNATSMVGGSMIIILMYQGHIQQNDRVINAVKFT